MYHLRLQPPSTVTKCSITSPQESMKALLLVSRLRNEPKSTHCAIIVSQKQLTRRRRILRLSLTDRHTDRSTRVWCSRIYDVIQFNYPQRERGARKDSTIRRYGELLDYFKLCTFQFSVTQSFCQRNVYQCQCRQSTRPKE